MEGGRAHVFKFTMQLPAHTRYLTYKICTHPHKTIVRNNNCSQLLKYHMVPNHILIISIFKRGTSLMHILPPCGT